MTSDSFSLTDKQYEATEFLGGAQRHSLLYGGSRSGKTFTIVRAIVFRALAAERSRHLIARLRNVDARTAILLDTLPEVMSLAFPGVPYRTNETDQVARFQNGSEFWIGGLDDKERARKILGKQYCTIALNECSEMSHNAVRIARSRLAQNAFHKDANGNQLPLTQRMFYDMNPEGSEHWTYQEFILKRKPAGGDLKHPDQYAAFQMNPKDNPHLTQEYLDDLEDFDESDQKRFLHGEFDTEPPGTLFPKDVFTKAELKGESQPKPSDMEEIVIAVFFY